MEDINFALVEEIRPPIYTAMKYWGKKPHNIWRKYIENYTPENGVYLDPFAGSAISAFEAVKANRKAIAFDINPLTSFIIEVFTSEFKIEKFKSTVNKILASFEKDSVYHKNFKLGCKKCGYEKATIQSFKWNDEKLYEIGVECKNCEREIKKKKSKISNAKAKELSRYLIKPTDKDQTIAKNISLIDINTWYPDKAFHKSPSFSANFIRCIGGNKFSNLWTRRNLYIISKIFDQILKVDEEDLKKQLLFGFIQSIHLCTKMSVPRREDANRPYSTSWGRSAFICAKRQMEMNALYTFYSSCIGKQSVESCLSSIFDYLKKQPKICYVNQANKQKGKLTGFDIKYGIVDINSITDYIEENTIDFIMTDPPYGGLVQYLDLSSIWLNWLEKYNKKYKPNYDAEITIKKDIINLDLYKKRFTNAIKNLYKVLKPHGKIVFTFHNKNLNIWNAFLKALTEAGFKVEKVIHQQNRRTGESNVANPYGTSATDFYIRCIKSAGSAVKTYKEEFEKFVIHKAIELIASRNEPTPYQILFNGLLTEISSAGYDLEDFDANIQKILSVHIGDIFSLTSNTTNKAGDYWWFVNPSKHIMHPNRLLSDRVEDSIVNLLRRKVSVTFDEVLAEIFVKYPNGLTPDIKSIDGILKKYAVKANGRWLYQYDKIEKEFTKHTEMLYKLLQIGKKLNYKVFIGKREQSEKYKGKKLSDFIKLLNLNILNLEPIKLLRIQMIDMVWLNDENKIQYVLEVENSTKFTSGIQRGSNLDMKVNKIMIIPDDREKEFLRTNDPLFKDNFINHNWKYLYYSDIDKLTSLQKITIPDLEIYLKNLK